MEETKKINNSIWTTRKKMGFSQKRVARCLGFRRTSDLSRYENGQRFPGLINALKLEIIYRTPVAFLYGNLYRELKMEIRKREEKIKS